MQTSRHAGFVLLALLSSYSLACRTDMPAKQPLSEITPSEPVALPIDKDALLLGLNNPPQKGAKIPKIYTGASKGSKSSLVPTAISDWKAAEKEARKDLLEKPQDPDALQLLSSALLQQGRYELAQVYAEQLEKSKDRKADGLNLHALSVHLASKGSREGALEAIKLLNSAIKAQHGHTASRLNLANISLEIGRVEAARKNFDAVIDFCKDCADAYMGLATTYALTGDHEQASQALKRLIANDPGNLEARLYLAVVYRDGFRSPEKAKLSLQELLQKAPPSAKRVRAQAKRLLKEL